MAWPCAASADFDRPGWLRVVRLADHAVAGRTPNAGLLGETTPDHHNEWAGTNWISFELNDDSLMRFLGPRRYFGVQNPDVADDLRSWYDESERQFGAGRSAPASRACRPARTLHWSISWVGEPGYGNWVAFRPPAALASVSPIRSVPRCGSPTDARSPSSQPRPAPMGRTHGPDAILMFFEPETRTSVFTFDRS